MSLKSLFSKPGTCIHSIFLPPSVDFATIPPDPLAQKMLSFITLSPLMLTLLLEANRLILMSGVGFIVSGIWFCAFDAGVVSSHKTALQ
jgi:hypothetical protein